MKALTLALLLSLPVPRLAQPTPVPTTPHVQQAHKGGRWYFAANLVSPEGIPSFAVAKYNRMHVLPQMTRRCAGWRWPRSTDLPTRWSISGTCNCGYGSVATVRLCSWSMVIPGPPRAGIGLHLDWLQPASQWSVPTCAAMGDRANQDSEMIIANRRSVRSPMILLS